MCQKNRHFFLFGQGDPGEKGNYLNFKVYVTEGTIGIK